MKIRKVRVNGDVATCLPDNATDFTHEVNLTNAEYDKAVNSSYFKVVDGDPVVKTQADRDADQLVIDKINWGNERDRLQNSAVIKYDNHFFDMSQESYRKMVDVRESLKRRNKTISWRCKDLNGDHARYTLSRSDIENISDAFSDAMEQIDLEADTGFPVDPWPLEI
jgi:hypothetical protein